MSDNINITSDPYFKDRLTMSEELQSKSIFGQLLYFSIIIGAIVVGIIYSKPYWQLIINKYNSPIAEKAEIIDSSNELNNNITENIVIKPEPIKEIKTIQPNPIEKTKIIQPETESSSSSINLENSNMPAVKPPIVTGMPKPKDNINTENTIAIPTANSAQQLLEQNNQQQIVSSTNEIISSSLANDIPLEAIKLIKLAYKQLEQMKLTIPKDDNAYATYKKLKKIAPPKEADKILGEIVNKLGLRFEEDLNKNRIEKANEIYQRLVEIAPKHEKTKSFNNSISEKLLTKGQSKISQNNLIWGNNTAYTTYKQMLKIIPENKQTKQLAQELTIKLNNIATQQMEDKHYSTPKNDNAYDSYKTILQISPNNVQAKKGLNKLIAAYITTANQYVNDKKYGSASTLIERALEISPRHRQLLNLKSKINRLKRRR
jgi:tetratricopeptide (TPR) repeat protein